MAFTNAADRRLDVRLDEVFGVARSVGYTRPGAMTGPPFS